MKKLLPLIMIFLLQPGIAAAVTSSGPTSCPTGQAPLASYDSTTDQITYTCATAPTGSASGGNLTIPVSQQNPTPTAGGKLTYTPLEPLPGGSACAYNSLSSYLSLVFNILLSIGAMIAVVTLVLGGITYMISEVVDKKAAARRRMWASIVGLLLLLTCWLILYNINPNLVKLGLPTFDTPCAGAGTPSTASGASSAGATVGSGAGGNPSLVDPGNTKPTSDQNTSCQNQNKTMHQDLGGNWTCS